MRARVVLVTILTIVAVTAAPTGSAAAASPEGGGGGWQQVAAGDFHACGINNGRLYCWGRDDVGQLAQATTDTPRASPVEVHGGFTDWTEVDAGGDTTCAIRTGTVYCWGADTFGQVGNGAPFTDRNTPIRIATLLTGFVDVSVGRNHACARRTGGHVYCWGRDSRGQLGDGGTNTDRGVPTLVREGDGRWLSVSAGVESTCGIRQVVTGPTNVARRVNCFSPTPHEFFSSWSDSASVRVGNSHICGHRSNGLIYCAGGDEFGELGNGGPTGVRTTATRVATFFADWVQIEAGAYFSTCARRATGRAYCWGRDQSGQLGNGPPATNANAPREVAGAHTDWTTLSLGVGFACGIRSAGGGQLYCWGGGFWGQLGNGTSGGSSQVFVPTAVNDPA